MSGLCLVYVQLLAEGVLPTDLCKYVLNEGRLVTWLRGCYQRCNDQGGVPCSFHSGGMTTGSPQRATHTQTFYDKSAQRTRPFPIIQGGNMDYEVKALP